MSGKKYAELRENYTQAGLLESEADASPFGQFQRWFDEALAAEILEANAMALATAAPAVRMVLLKGFDERGFQFYSNYGSAKAKELELNSAAALCFHWKELERQVRARGTVEKLSREESEAYFRERPRGSQIGAWCSAQSERIASRETLEQAQRHYEQRFRDQEVPMPECWGGYLMRPEEFEFWQGRPGRLHDRIHYSRDENHKWRISRLSP